MRLQELLEQDYTAAGTRFTDAQFELAYRAVSKAEMTKEEINDAAQMLAERDEFGRSKASAEFVLTRMHILVHGLAPIGETEKRAETMFTIPRTMIQFAQRKGLDVYDNIEYAREELKTRPVRVKRPEAVRLMADYYNANKHSLPRGIATHREEIINLIMNGTPPAEAFNQFS